MSASLPRIAAIVIGRNEGARLGACLASLRGEVDRLVYVDSGSTDGSLVLARDMGVETVDLDPAQPFTAARARNAGVAALGADPPPFLQFVDGDCTVEPGWITAGRAALNADPHLGLVTGWRTEIHPDANPFHAMAEVEWHRPAGKIAACGGDMMVRSAAFAQIGGFDPALIASEDEDLVIRIRKAGFGALRLPLVMTRHDIAMSRFGAWWRRHLRTGNGLAEVGDLHPPHYRAERRRAVIFGLVLPLTAGGALAAGLWPVTLLALAAHGPGFGRNLGRLRRAGMAGPLALRVACLFLLVKLPHFLGMARFYLRGGRRATIRLIEYK